MRSDSGHFCGGSLGRKGVMRSDGIGHRMDHGGHFEVIFPSS